MNSIYSICFEKIASFKLGIKKIGDWGNQVYFAEMHRGQWILGYIRQTTVEKPQGYRLYMVCYIT